MQTIFNKNTLAVAAATAGIILGVFLLIWVPFKLLPKIFSGGSNFIATTLTSTFIPSDEKEKDSKTTDEKKTGTDEKTKTGTKTPVSYSGYPDLSVNLVAVGVIGANGQFIQTNTVGQNDKIAVRFDVRNIGTNVSGNWTLRINVPSRTTPITDSGYQQSIRPNDRMQFTATFDNALGQGVYNAYITIDPMGMVNESNESNNSLVIPINISGTSVGYNNYTYPYYYNNGTSYQNPNGSYTWNNITATCSVLPQQARVGQAVTWYGTASGGNGSFTYNWTGTDNLNANTMVTDKTYFTQGLKTAYLTVTSNGQAVTQTCNVYVY